MFGLFVVLWAAQSVSGWHAANADNREHHQPAKSYQSYLTTGHFVEATAENWESEFLQMSGYVFLTAFLRQQGSPESKPFEDDETDEDPRQADNREDVPWPVRRGGLVLTVYEHSFALTLFAIFLACSLSTRRGRGLVQPGTVGPWRARGFGWSVPDHLAVLVPVVSELAERVLCVGAVALLGIRLRERGSPESKPVAAPHGQTGQASKLSFSAALSLPAPRTPNLAV